MDGFMTSLEDANDCLLRRAHVVFLTLNDVYELIPNAYGQGGVAEFKTLLDSTRAAVERDYPDATILVTLNGDFLWRSELDRKDKGPLMMNVLQCLGIEFVVMGNHEFDHSAMYLKQLLQSATFTSFGSNIREATNGALMERLADTMIVPLRDGLKLGMFGVCTPSTGDDPFAGHDVRFEDELSHAKRCVAQLQADGADVIVALTHLKMKHDTQLARRVPEIALILGGHDHEPMTTFVGNAMIHKSGQDALWLGKIQLHITKDDRRDSGLAVPSTRIDYAWDMLYNRGYAPHPETRAVVDQYLQYVEEDDRANGKLHVIARALTALDGTRFTCRTGESSVGFLVTDALRIVLEADVAIIHAGLIKGDLFNPPGLDITPRWLERTLPQPRVTVVIELRVRDLQAALTHMLRRYPAMSSSKPHLSGLHAIYDISSGSGQLTSLRLVSEPDQELVHSDRVLRVALPIVKSLDGWTEYFETPCAHATTTGPIVRDVVALYLTRHATHNTVSYASTDHRLEIIETIQPVS